MSAVLRLCLSLLLGLVLAGRAWAIDPLPFADADQETRFRALVAELRCLQCQNQNLADSDAQIAKDLRREIFDQIAAGRSDDEIVAFLVDRYGEFVRYRPPLNANTLLLWLGPALILLGGLVAVGIHLRRRRQTATSSAKPAPTDDEHDW
ncbi:MAG: cytochrome c-type biogenesis protein [Lysobacterales bacterium]